MLSEAYLFFSGSVATLAETSSQQGTAKHQLCQIYTICTLWYMEITFTNQDSRVPFSALWFSSIANSRGGGGNFPLLRWNTLIHWLQCCSWSKWLSQMQQASEAAAVQTRWRHTAQKFWCGAMKRQSFSPFRHLATSSSPKKGGKMCPSYLWWHQLPGEREAQNSSQPRGGANNNVMLGVINWLIP